MRSVSPVRAPVPSSGHADIIRPAAWSPLASGRISAALLLAGPEATDAIEPLKRCFATALPDADLVPFAGQDRRTLVRQTFAEARADCYVVADRLRDPLAVARAVAAVARDGDDLVVVTGLPQDAFADVGDHLLTITLEYLFGRGAGVVDAAAVACSPRFAACYAGDGSALDLALHALRRRMPVGEVGSADLVGPGSASRRVRTARDWLALAALIATLFAEERPRRTFGAAGFGAMAAGVAAALPSMRFHGLHSAVTPGWESAASLGLIGAGVGAAAAGLLLDTMVKARQDVSRIGYMALKRGTDPAIDAALDGAPAHHPAGDGVSASSDRLRTLPGRDRRA